MMRIKIIRNVKIKAFRKKMKFMTLNVKWNLIMKNKIVLRMLEKMHKEEGLVKKLVSKKK